MRIDSIRPSFRPICSDPRVEAEDNRLCALRMSLKKQYEEIFSKAEQSKDPEIKKLACFAHDLVKDCMVDKASLVNVLPAIHSALCTPLDGPLAPVISKCMSKVVVDKWEHQNSTFDKVMKFIQDDPHTSDSTKSLIDFQKSTRDLGLHSSWPAYFSKLIFDTVGKGMISPLGLGLARILLDKEVKDKLNDDDVLKMNRNAFKALADCPDASRKEKAIATVGMAFIEERDLSGWRKNALCRQLFMDLESGQGKSFARSLKEKVSDRDFSNFSSPLQGQIVSAGFTILLHSPDASRDEKELARRETEALLQEKITPEEAWKLLKSLPNPGSVKEELARLKEMDEKRLDATVQEMDDCLFINNLRLDINR